MSNNLDLFNYAYIYACTIKITFSINLSWDKNNPGMHVWQLLQLYTSKNLKMFIKFTSLRFYRAIKSWTEIIKMIWFVGLGLIKFDNRIRLNTNSSITAGPRLV